MRTNEISIETIRGDDRGYVAYHAPRYAYLLKLLSTLQTTSRTRVLDIGPSRLTDLIRTHFGISVDTLGFGKDSRTAAGSHFEFDLNLAQETKSWRTDLSKYDVVIMAEVLEHLHTAPELVLDFVKTLLANNGTLIIQTPNAAALPKRLKLLAGVNPYEMFRVDIGDPGHYREYTISELRRFAKIAGFHVQKCSTSFYFDARFARHKPGQVAPQPLVGFIKNTIYRLLPGNLREGITMVWTRTLTGS